MENVNLSQTPQFCLLNTGKHESNHYFLLDDSNSKDMNGNPVYQVAPIIKVDRNGNGLITFAQYISFEDLIDELNETARKMKEADKRFKKLLGNGPREVVAESDCICMETDKPIKKGNLCMYSPRTKNYYHYDSNVGFEYRHWFQNLR